MARIQFLTDSAADLPVQLREQPDIRVLPFPIAMEDREYMDCFDFTPQEFYEMLLATDKIPTHAQLTAYLFEESFEQSYQAGYTDLIYTSINAKASSTYDNAMQAKESFFHEHPEAAETFSIHIINAGNYTMSYGWAVSQGAKMAQNGASVEEIVAYIKDWVAHARVLFAPLDLRFAKKSGRVSAAAAFMGEALGLKPVMTFQDGESKILAKVRGEKNVISAMLDICQRSRVKDSPYLIIRANNADMADKLTAACEETLGQSAELSYYIGGVIAINAGPNLIGMIYREE